MKLNTLITNITSAHGHFHTQATRQVNLALTLRNWVVGFYIVEYEQSGKDRAEYGAKLLETIAEKLSQNGIRGLSLRPLRSCRSFYLMYPQIRQTLSAEFQIIDNERLIARMSPSKGNPSIPKTDPEHLLSKLTFSHFVELMKIGDELARTFYEVQAIKNSWGVRDLRQAMNSMLFERTGLSTDKAAVLARHSNEKKLLPEDVVKDPYFLDFLGLEDKSYYSESDLEQAIIDHLQKFLLEMGKGFCFEARQKRIPIDNKHHRIDLVFYHRILKCHVLLDLKIGEFEAGDAGQMNLYLNYFKDNEMTEADAEPIGIVLCADKNDTVVKYATGGLSQNIFVSKYLVNLPKVEELITLVRKEQMRLGAV